MIDFSKQFAVISKLKSLVKISRSFRRNAESQISESVAKKIQKSSYEKNQHLPEDTFTPPYLEIAVQLQSENEQIFKAAFFNLSNIAMSRKAQTPAILSLLEKILEDKSKTKDQLDYVRSKILQIKQAA